MPERVCSETGCDEKHYARGWCQRHYLIWWRGKQPKELERRRHRTKVKPWRYV